MQNRIKELRYSYKLTQNDLSRKLNISRQTLSLIENNKSIPSVLLSIKIAKTFSESVTNIFFLEDTDLTN
ncbi:transcriptional regulator [Staphylococcus chromogenes]|uniref:helix-turn-helix transcriptional regulator n=1 Tax=Staphylococcus chromogenes TaxID=46126 RepID=UPI000D1AD66A|nr:helix-turn-helix transcriptional regulator [Staphylococcus chromogenes]PTG77368.1 transcriptional regulator [Staphylococcus chromogenes]RIM14500.1 transcriptional regulator [Staphylococcus chromogenes]